MFKRLYVCQGIVTDAWLNAFVILQYVVLKLK